MNNFKSLRYVKDIKSMYTIGDKLGEGSFGQVVRCTRLVTKKEHAMKIIRKSKMAGN
jgi:serine/threonine protein kinase